MALPPTKISALDPLSTWWPGGAMKIPAVQDQAIAARMALIVGADNFDRLFRGVQFDEFDGDVLSVYTADEYRAAEIEETFSLHISTIAAAILKCAIPIVMVLAQKLKQERGERSHSITKTRSRVEIESKLPSVHLQIHQSHFQRLNQLGHRLDPHRRKIDNAS